MKKKSGTEYANEKINDYFSEDTPSEKVEIDPLIDNNAISLVLKNLNKDENDQ